MDRVDRLAERLLAECELTEDQAYMIAEFVVDELPQFFLSSPGSVLSICVGTAIRNMRIDGGWTLPEAAGLAGVHRTSIINWEQGKMLPSRREAFVKLLGVYGAEQDLCDSLLAAIKTT